MKKAIAIVTMSVMLVGCATTETRYNPNTGQLEERQVISGEKLGAFPLYALLTGLVIHQLEDGGHKCNRGHHWEGEECVADMPPMATGD